MTPWPHLPSSNQMWLAGVSVPFIDEFPIQSSSNRSGTFHLATFDDTGWATIGSFQQYESNR